MVPDLSPASATKSTGDKAAMITFRLGNRNGSGELPHGSMETTAPPWATVRLNTASDELGYMRSAPQPDTITVFPPASSAAALAALSHPMAPPETTTIPLSAATRPAICDIAMP
jgi:hypothetical protein